MNKEITLTDFFRFILSKLKLILILGCIAAVVTFGVVRFTAETKYNYYGSLFVNPFGEVNEDYTSNAKLSEVNIANTLMPTYVAILQSNNFGDYIAQTVKEDYNIKVNSSQVIDMIRYTTSDDILIISYRCTSSDKDLSYAVAKTIDEKAPEYILGIINHGTIAQVNRVKKDNFTTSTTGAAAMAIVAFAVVAVVTVLVSLLIELFDNRIKSVDDLTEKFDYPVLGNIPNFYSNKKEEGYYGNEKAKETIKQ